MYLAKSLFDVVDEKLTGQASYSLVFEDLNVCRGLTKMKHIQMNWDIDVFRAPCEMIDLMVHVPQTKKVLLTKSRIYPNQTKEKMSGFRDPTSAAIAYLSGEGCNLQGTILQSSDTNQFTLFFGYPEAITEVMRLNSMPSFNLSHKINHLSFGNPSICKDTLK